LLPAKRGWRNVRGRRATLAHVSVGQVLFAKIMCRGSAFLERIRLLNNDGTTEPSLFSNPQRRPGTRVICACISPRSAAEPALRAEWMLLDDRVRALAMWVGDEGCER
jgi:hypothetical protein